MALTQITEKSIKDGEIVNADINASAAIARTKLANVDLVDDTSPQLGGNLDLNNRNIKGADSTSDNSYANRIKLGSSDDLQLYHDGTDSIISHQGGTGGDLILQTTGSDDDVFIKCNDDFIVNVQGGAENAIIARNNGEVELYYDASKKFETTSSGATVTGQLNVTGVLKFDNSTNSGLDIRWEPSSNSLDFVDNVKARFGTGNDLEIYHDGSHSYLQDVGSGALRIRSDSEVAIQKWDGSDNENMAKFIPDGAVELYHNNVKTLETDANGVRVGDGQRYIVGDDADGYLRYSSSTVELYVAHAQPFKVNLGGETALLATANGSVDLYHNNTKRFDTTSSGFQGYGTAFKFADAADVELILNADTDNSNESHNPSILFQQDGSTNCLRIGVEGSAGTAFTNSTGNWGYIQALDGHGGLGIEFATDGTRRMQITLGGSINGDFNDTSDGNLKENIVSISSTIDKVKSLRPVTFDWKDKTKEKNYSGFIAQEVKAIYPNIITGEEHTTEEPWKNYSLNTVGLVAYLTKALQEAITKIETLETKVAALEAA